MKTNHKKVGMYCGYMIHDYEKMLKRVTDAWNSDMSDEEYEKLYTDFQNSYILVIPVGDLDTVYWIDQDTRKNNIFRFVCYSSNPIIKLIIKVSQFEDWKFRMDTANIRYVVNPYFYPDVR